MTISTEFYQSFFFLNVIQFILSIDKCEYLLTECVRLEPIRVQLFAQFGFGIFNVEWFQTVLFETISSAAKIFV